MNNYFGSVKAHYKYSRREIIEILITTALVALMFAFDDGMEVFSFAYWGMNYFGTFIMWISLIISSDALIFACAVFPVDGIR